MWIEEVYRYICVYICIYIRVPVSPLQVELHLRGPAQPLAEGGGGHQVPAGDVAPVQERGWGGLLRTLKQNPNP